MQQHRTLAHLLSKKLNLPEEPLPLFPCSQYDMEIGEQDCSLFVGDNLEVLSLLAMAHAKKIDFCYIDPPYNTGSKFVYDDRRQSPDVGIWGKHACWMSFMLPRLTLMHALLKDSGVAAISIDDYEYAHLKILMDHIFGANHYFGTLIVHRSKNGKGSKNHIAVSHEYILVYGKTNKAKILGLPEGDISSYNKEDAHGCYKIDGLFRKKGEASLRSERPNMYYPLYYDELGNVFVERSSDNLKEAFPIDSKGVERRWLWGLDKTRAEKWKLFASPKGVIYVKNYLTDEKRIKIRSIWDDPRYLTERATNEITDIFGDKVFDTPKPIGLIEDLIKCCAEKNALVLDFFCGSGTTAHAVHNLNQADGGKRQAWMIEQNAIIPQDHKASKKGFFYISDITEHRLKKIIESSPTYTYKVFKPLN